MKKKNKIILASITLGLMGGGFLTGVIVPHLKKSTNIENNVNVENNNKDINISNQNNNLNNTPSNQTDNISSNIEINVLIEEIQTQIDKLKVYQNYYQNKLNVMKEIRNENELNSLKNEINQWFQDHNGVALHVVMDNLNKDTTYDMFNEIRIINDQLNPKDNVELKFNVILEKIVAKENAIKKLEPFKQNVETLSLWRKRSMNTNTIENPEGFIFNFFSNNLENLVDDPNLNILNNDDDLEDNLFNQKEYETFGQWEEDKKYDKLLELHNYLKKYREFVFKREKMIQSDKNMIDQRNNKDITNIFFPRLMENKYQKFEEWIPYFNDIIKNKNTNSERFYNYKNALNDILEYYGYFFSPMKNIIENEQYNEFLSFYNLDKNVIYNFKKVLTMFLNLRTHIRKINGEIDFNTWFRRNQGTLSIFWQRYFYKQTKDMWNGSLETILDPFTTFQMTTINVLLQYNVANTVHHLKENSLKDWFSNSGIELSLYFKVDKGNRFHFPINLQTPFFIDDINIRDVWEFYNIVNTLKKENVEFTNSINDFETWLLKMVHKIDNFYETEDLTKFNKYYLDSGLIKINSIDFFKESFITNEEYQQFIPLILELQQRWKKHMYLFEYFKNISKFLEDLLTNVLNHYNVLDVAKEFMFWHFSFWNNNMERIKNPRTYIKQYLDEFIMRFQNLLSEIDKLEETKKQEMLNFMITDSFESKFFIKNKHLIPNLTKIDNIRVFLEKIIFSNILDTFYIGNKWDVNDNKNGFLLNNELPIDFLDVVLSKTDNFNYGSSWTKNLVFGNWLFSNESNNKIFISREILENKPPLKYNVYQYLQSNNLFEFSDDDGRYNLYSILDIETLEKISNSMIAFRSESLDEEEYNATIQKVKQDIDNKFKNAILKLLEHEITQGKFFEKYNTYSEEQKQQDPFYVKITNSLSNWNSLSLEQIKELFIDFNNYAF